MQRIRKHGSPLRDSGSINSLAPAVVFVNPAAGSGRALTYLSRIQEVFDRAAIAADFVSFGDVRGLEAGVGAAIRGGKRQWGFSKGDTRGGRQLKHPTMMQGGGTQLRVSKSDEKWVGMQLGATIDDQRRWDAIGGVQWQ